MSVYDIAIIGGSLGGVQAAKKAAQNGMKVYLCEETDWIGGQLTSQGVPPDEHSLIEECGATRGYLEYRQAVRKYYRELPHATELMKKMDKFCPGNSWVSRIAHEPKVALQLLIDSIQPYLDEKIITIDYFTIAKDASVENDTINEVIVKNIKTKKTKKIKAKYYLDATDCGDLLPIVGAEYRMGAESKWETGEPHAPAQADPFDMQPITWVAALELNPMLKDMIVKPVEYDILKKLGVPYDDNSLLSWYGPDAMTGKKSKFAMFDGEVKKGSLGLWSYRRIIDSIYYNDKRNEVTLLNWPQNDYSFGNIYGDKNSTMHIQRAKELTKCLVYWLQNDAVRVDGMKGYSVGLRPDIMGTEDGLAKAPYIRESRRIIAKKTICEQDISRACNQTIPQVVDSVGVGHYAVDIHLTTRSHSFFYEPTWPFEIPLSAMIPVRIHNLIPSCKNIGCTHLTNGCYRLHPVEWNVGEVAGLLASFCLRQNCTLDQVLNNRLREFQNFLVKEGIQLHWDIEKWKGLL